MSKFKLLIIVFFLGTYLSIAQKIVKNETDEFTGSSIKQSDWNTLSMTRDLACYFRISQVNNKLRFDLKLNLAGKVFSIDKGQEIMFKLSNNEIVKLENVKYTVTCNGCAAKGIVGSNTEGIQVTYYLTQEKLKLLTDNEVVKVRVYTSEGYVEDSIKAKNYRKLKGALSLF